YFFIFTINMFAYQQLEVKTYVDTVPKHIQCYIGADIGGTNSDFGIFEVKEHIPHLLFSLHIKTENIENFVDVVHDVISYAYNNYGIIIKHACFAAPGVASKEKDYA